MTRRNLIRDVIKPWLPYACLDKLRKEFATWIQARFLEENAEEKGKEDEEFAKLKRRLREITTNIWEENENERKQFAANRLRLYNERLQIDLARLVTRLVKARQVKALNGKEAEDEDLKAAEARREEEDLEAERAAALEAATAAPREPLRRSRLQQMERKQPRQPGVREATQTRRPAAAALALLTPEPLELNPTDPLP